MAILVTGATGYIGSHISLELLKEGYEVILLDNLMNSKRSVVDKIEKISNKKIIFYEIDLLNKDNLNDLFIDNKIEGVIHLAALKSVFESISNPLKYYENNIGGLLNLCSIMDGHNIRNLVFSSSATVYGDKNISPLTEDMPLSTINPYGSTKLVSEQILKELYHSNNKWNISILRYFNPVGADESGLIGEDPTNIPTNIMPIINRVASERMAKMYVFGNDYNTPDGTCIRDFIHITDLAKGHIRAVEKNKENKGLNIYNLGTGRGYSVLELINTFQKVTGQKINYEYSGKRPGDMDICFANPNKALKELNWEAKYDLEKMCIDSWRWETNNDIR